MPKDFITKHDISVMPLFIYVDEVEYLDKVNITLPDIFKFMKEGKSFRTAQVGFDHIRDTFERILGGGDDVLCLTISSKLSSTYSFVEAVASDMAQIYKDSKMAVIDSKGGSLATGLIAMQAAKMAQNGFSFDDIVADAKTMTGHIEHIFMLDDLDSLVRGGRLSKTAGFAANILNIKPVLEVHDGQMQVVAKVRGRLKSMHAVADIVKERAKNFTDQTIGISHCDDIDSANEMKALLLERLPESEYLIEMIGANLGIHLGPGGVGVFFLNERPPNYIK